MKIKPKAFFVISAWNNDVSWVEEYTDDYLIFDKSHNLPESDKIRRINNVGYNINDICLYIIENYNNLPPLVAFLEGDPWTHCKRETFDKLIYNEFFTPLEDYSNVPESSAYRKDPVDGGYMEINTSWYLYSHSETHGSETHRYFTFYNEFLDAIFENPEFKNPRYLKWIRFSPGGQYIVPKENILFYSKKFYEKLMSYVDYHRIPAEAFLIERALYYIFTNKWREK